MDIGIGLYVKNSAEAVPFYMDVFGLVLGYHVKNEDCSFFHSELNRAGKEVLSVVEASGADIAGTCVSLGVDMPDEASVQLAFNKLREGGRVLMEVGPLPWSPCAAEVVDRFGVRWYITAPQHRPPEGWKP